MKNKNKYDIFISYSRKDFKKVESLVAKIKQSIPTITYWLDLNAIEGGDYFEDRIINAIDNSDFVLFILSDNSMKSPWTKDEVIYANNIGKKVLPILLNNTVVSSGWFLYKFGRIDCIDSTDSLQMNKLIRNLSEWTHKPIAQNLTEYNNKENKPLKLKIKSIVLISIAVITIALGGWNIYLHSSEWWGINQKIPQVVLSDNYEWVDLGLSVMWASCNIGAEKPEQFGDYYAWGEVIANNDYIWESYVHGAPNNKLTKYCNDTSLGYNNYTDNKITLDLEDDVAYIKCGKKWRIPTSDEMKELCDCQWEWTQINNVNGYKITGKNGNSIFLPAAGSIDGKNKHYEGIGGFYWCNNLNQEASQYAYNLGFNIEEFNCNNDGYRLIKRSIRPVYVKRK